MIIYCNSDNEIKDVGTTLDSTLIPFEIDDTANPFLGWSTAKICCYKVNVSDGRVTMMTPYVDSRLIEHIDRLSTQTENVVTDNHLDSLLKQARVNAESNTDEQALDVKDLYDNWEDIPEGAYLKEGLFLNYEEDLYKVRDGHGHNKQTAWNPKDASSEFVKVQIEEEPEWKPYPEVEGYTYGQIVRHNGYRWENIYESGLNIWEPSDVVPTLWRNLGFIPA